MADFLARTRSGIPAVQLGYAVTGHVAQGLTTDRTFVLGTDRLFREWGYVAMSRGRLSNRMYAVVGEPRVARDEFAPSGVGDVARSKISSSTASSARTVSSRPS